MNIEKYATILAKYNNVFSHKNHKTKIIVIPFKENKWVSKYLSRIKSFDKVIYNCKRPVIKAFKAFYRTDCIASVFLQQNNSHTILMGNERILFSHPEGKTYLCLTPFWVKNASCIDLRSGVGAGCGTDNIFPHLNAILFLDELQTPYPGGCYYTRNRSRTTPIPPSKIDEYMRICYITRDLSILDDIFIAWNGKQNIEHFPFITKTTILTISKFIQPFPIQNVSHFPESVVKSTSLITKKLSRSNPNFLIQDILNTYLSASGSVDNVGLFIEYPFECDYENSCGNAEDGTCYIDNKSSSSSNDPQQYVAFYVNGLNPKKILQVRRPYDRYMEYENFIPDIQMHLWTKILYDPREELPFNVSRVVIDNTILGYCYKGAFLCLAYPALSSFVIPFDHLSKCGSKNLDTDCLLSPMKENDLKHDNNIFVIDKYPYDRTHHLYHIKHKNIRNDLWCLSRIDDNKYYNDTFCKISDNANRNSDEPPSKYPKKADPPLFVSKWLSFYDKHKDQNNLHFGNLDLFKLALILARHKICFKLKRGNSREISYVSGEYEIRLEEPLVNYINEIRLLPAEEGHSGLCTTVHTTEKDNAAHDDHDEEYESGCVIA